MRSLLFLAGGTVVLAIAAACVSSHPIPVGPDDASSGSNGTPSSGDAAPAEARFTIEVQPSSVVLDEDGSKAVTVKLTRSAGFADAVDILVTDLPPGATAAPLTIAESVGVLELTTQAAPFAAAKAATITGNSGGSRSASTQLSVAVAGAAGDKDPSFAGNGEFVYDPGNTGGTGFTPVAALTQPDGKIVIGGTHKNNTAEHFQLVRLNADGTLDGTFGSAGTSAINDELARGAMSAMALQKNGSIVAVGTETQDNLTSARAMRFDASGTIDATFGANGKVLLTRGSGADRSKILARDVIISKDDSIYLVGYYDDNTPAVNQGILGHYDANGKVDAAFGTEPEHYTSYTFQTTTSEPPVKMNTGFHTAAVQDNGTIIAGGWFDPETPNDAQTFFRVFDVHGKVAGTPSANTQRTVTRESAGVMRAAHQGTNQKVIAIGDQVQSDTSTDLWVVGLGADGSDSSTVRFPLPNRDEHAVGFATMSNGKYVILVSSLVQGKPQPCVIRFDTASKPDATWGGNPASGALDVFDPGTTAAAITIAADDAIIVVGGVTSGTVDKAVVRRFFP